jgi:hypothetical protein
MTGAIRLTLTRAAMAPEYLAILPEPERGIVAEVSARDDTALLTMADDNGLLGYAVIGIDLQGLVVVYAARAMQIGLGSVALISIFGAARVLHKPIRVHVDKVGRALAMARAAGVTMTGMGADGDGVSMAFFDGQ